MALNLRDIPLVRMRMCTYAHIMYKPTRFKKGAEDRWPEIVYVKINL